MDFDAVSNISNQSDELRSNASTLSDLSIYQDEFVELRHLVNPTKYPTATFDRCSTPKQDSGCELPYNDLVLDISDQLQNSLKLNEKYKNDMFNLEKVIELRFYEKIEKLLRNNSRLKSELEIANEQIERLIRSFSNKNDTSSLLDTNCIRLEQKCHELSMQNSTLQYELLANKNQKEEYESENKQLKIERNELNIDIEARHVCIKELKERISQQHVEIQSLLKNNLMSSQSIKEVSSDLEHLKKVQEWYKDQLHMCQDEKRLLSNEILKCKTDLSSQRENTDMLNVDIAKWKHKCDIIQFEALKEKERLCKELENMNFTNVSNNQSSNFIENNDNKSIVNYYETSIQDLTNEITKIKEYVQEQDKTYNKIAKENSELIAHCITLQKTIQQNEMSIEELESSKKYLNMELNLIKERVKEKSEEFTSSKKQIFSLEAELTVRNQEQSW
ncbi:hypothetical protein NQ314_021311 [Rhamnusium bicolor]|uniref:Uncharacterized protein n=1 Tax=Rhamnusium bicolor TaxID=1586634 RepID=A0AAV8WIP2_9CUCU|nr:hypothetical protein NQ314_021311 [Rhamnusium bicolor]